MLSDYIIKAQGGRQYEEQNRKNNSHFDICIDIGNVRPRLQQGVINGTTCTLVFKIGNSDDLYCLDNYPLSNLDY